MPDWVGEADAVDRQGGRAGPLEKPVKKVHDVWYRTPELAPLLFVSKCAAALAPHTALPLDVISQIWAWLGITCTHPHCKIVTLTLSDMWRTTSYCETCDTTVRVIEEGPFFC